MSDVVFHLTLLALASSALFVPLLWRKQNHWLDPLALFGGSVLIFALGKYIFLTFIKPRGDMPVWAIAAELHNGVWTTTLFSVLAILAYVVFRSSVSISRPAKAETSLDMRLIYFVAILVVAIAVTAFVSIFLSTEFSISWTSISAKRFLDNDLGPAARVGTFEYLLFKGTLLARVPLYAIFVGVLLRGKAHTLDKILLTMCFLSIFITAFVFSNRFNLLLVFIDLGAIAAVIGRRKITPRYVFLGLLVFAAVIVTSELRIGEGRDKTVLEHMYEGRYFTDVSRTAKIVDYYQTAELHDGATFYNWILIGLPDAYGDGGLAFLNMGWDMGYHVFGQQASGVPPGFIAELYMNFATPGLLLGGLIFGMVAAYLAIRLYDAVNIPWLALLMTMLAIRWGLVLFNGNFGTAIIKMVLEAVPAALLVWFATRATTRRKTGIGQEIAAPIS